MNKDRINFTKKMYKKLRKIYFRNKLIKINFNRIWVVIDLFSSENLLLATEKEELTFRSMLEGASNLLI